MIRFSRSGPTLRLPGGIALTLEGGICISGVPGSAKTTGSTAYLLRALYADPHVGGLILCATAEEAERQLAYLYDARAWARAVRFSRGHRFNAFAWGYRHGLGIEDLTALFMELAQVAGRARFSAAGGDSAVWLQHMQAMVRPAIALLLLAQGAFSVYDLHRLILSAPADRHDPARETWRRDSFCWETLQAARARVAALADARRRHDLALAEDYFLHHLARLNPRTRTSIEAVFTAVSSPLLYSDLHPTFNRDVTVDPADVFRQGLWIVMDIPAEEHGEAALLGQVMLKSCFQLACRRRPVHRHSRYAALIADEAQLYAVPSADTAFLATARNKRALAVFTLHGVSELSHRLGREAAEAWLGYMRVFVFHAADLQTARFASALTESWHPQVSRTVSYNETVAGAYGLFWNAALRWLGAWYSASRSDSLTVTDRHGPELPVAAFQSLRNGGPAHRFRVDCYLFQSSRRFRNGKHWTRVTLLQDFARRRSLLRRLGRWASGKPPPNLPPFTGGG
jgi:hypothetical protein